MSPAGAQQDSGRRRGRAAQGDSRNGSISSGNRRRCWPGCRRRRRGPCWPRDGDGTRPSMPDRPRSSSIAPRPPTIATISPRGAPVLWVALRPTGVEPPYDVVAVTADPAEGESLTEAGNDLVDVVPMPEPVRELIEAFVAEHHVERPFYKRKRDRADPEALARRGPMRKERTDERSGKVSRALVAAQARGGRRRRRSDAGCAGRPAGRRTPARTTATERPATLRPRRQRTAMRSSRRSISRGCRRSNSITAATDIRAFLAPGVPPDLDPCGASPRLGRRPQDQGFRRPRGLRLGLSRAGIDGRFRAARDDRGAAPAGGADRRRSHAKRGQRSRCSSPPGEPSAQTSIESVRSVATVDDRRGEMTMTVATPPKIDAAGRLGEAATHKKLAHRSKNILRCSIRRTSPDNLQHDCQRARTDARCRMTMCRS